jgi:SOS-response transcriptional repressor LexA
MTVTPLTPSQKAVFDVLARYYAENGYMPSHSELGLLMGKGYSTIHRHIEGCIERGWLRKIPGKSRAISLT